MRDDAVKVAGLVAVILGLILVGSVAWANPQQDRWCPIYPDDPRCQNWVPPNPTTTTLGTTTTGGTSSTTQPTTTTVPTTTTTTAPSSTTTSIPSTGSAIAALGCSNTALEVNGYLQQSSQDNLINVATPGDTVNWWANFQNGWVNQYLPNRPASGYDGAWVNLCERASSGLTAENIQKELDKIWSYDPGIPIWISPLNFYTDESCTVTSGNQIPNEGALLADQFAAADPLVFRGPDLGPLGSGMLRADNCHPNQSGIDLAGSQLVEFFDQ